MILAGDIGGTKTHLGIFQMQGRDLKEVSEEIFASQEFDGLESVIDTFKSRHKLDVNHACFSIAGPVIDNTVKTTNLPWTVDARKIASKFDFEKVWLINDLEANAHGITHLRDEEFVVLHEGVAGQLGNACVVSAGTGLGEAGMFWNGDGYIPFACEGGHTDFAPRNDEEIELFKYLRRDMAHQHVSYERVLSGMGLHNIYSFLRDTKRFDEPEWLANALASSDDQASTISHFALEGKSELCEKALDMFVDIYGAEAGNAALKFMAFGGVFIGGGIAPKIIEKMKSSTFLDAFLRKGRMKGLLERMPIKVISNSRTALLGAARCALLKSGKLPARVMI
jgi:glucokinase, proteobacterial type